MYHKLGIPFEEILGIAKNLECIVFKITTIDTYVAIIYRPPKYCISAFMAALNFLLDNLENLSTKIVVTGDFNQDILSNNKTVLNCMSSRGFTQYVDEPTTENGTLIDRSVPSTRDKLQGVALGPLIYYFGGFGPKSTGLEDDSDEEVCDCYCK